MKAENFQRYRVKPSANVSLKAVDPDETSAFSGGKDEADKVLGELKDRYNVVIHASKLGGK